MLTIFSKIIYSCDLNCEPTFSLNYQSVNIKIFFLNLDFHTVTYGLSVPKTIQNYVPLNMGLNTFYVAANAEILADGYLRGLQIYAETAGTVKLMVTYNNFRLL